MQEEKEIQADRPATSVQEEKEFRLIASRRRCRKKKKFRQNSRRRRCGKKKKFWQNARRRRCGNPQYLRSRDAPTKLRLRLLPTRCLRNFPTKVCATDPARDRSCSATGRSTARARLRRAASCHAPRRAYRGFGSGPWRGSAECRCRRKIGFHRRSPPRRSGRRPRSEGPSGALRIIQDEGRRSRAAQSDDARQIDDPCSKYRRYYHRIDSIREQPFRFSESSTRTKPSWSAAPRRIQPTARSRRKPLNLKHPPRSPTANRRHRSRRQPRRLMPTSPHLCWRPRRCQVRHRPHRHRAPEVCAHPATIEFGCNGQGSATGVKQCGAIGCSAGRKPHRAKRRTPTKERRHRLDCASTCRRRREPTTGAGRGSAHH